MKGFTKDAPLRLTQYGKDNVKGFLKTLVDAPGVYFTPVFMITGAVVTLERAVKNVPDEYRYIVAVNSEGRLYPVFVGETTLHLVHSGFCVVN